MEGATPEALIARLDAFASASDAVSQTTEQAKDASAPLLH